MILIEIDGLSKNEIEKEFKRLQSENEIDEAILKPINNVLIKVYEVYNIYKDFINYFNKEI